MGKKNTDSSSPKGKIDWIAAIVNLGFTGVAVAFDAIASEILKRRRTPRK